MSETFAVSTTIFVRVTLSKPVFLNESGDSSFHNRPLSFFAYPPGYRRKIVSLRESRSLLTAIFPYCMLRSLWCTVTATTVLAFRCNGTAGSASGERFAPRSSGCASGGVKETERVTGENVRPAGVVHGRTTNDCYSRSANWAGQSDDLEVRETCHVNNENRLCCPTNCAPNIGTERRTGLQK